MKARYYTRSVLHSMMLKTSCVFLFLCGFNGFFLSVNAQSYGNEWIDYQKTYYKFKLAQEGIYRIPYETLVVQGLDTVPVHAFQLWHLGRQVPLYVSSAGDTLKPGDYLELLASEMMVQPIARFINKHPISYRHIIVCLPIHRHII